MRDYRPILKDLARRQIEAEGRVLVLSELTPSATCTRTAQRNVTLDLARSIHDHTSLEVDVLFGPKAWPEELESYLLLIHNTTEETHLVLCSITPYGEQPDRYPTGSDFAIHRFNTVQVCLSSIHLGPAESRPTTKNIRKPSG